MDSATECLPTKNNPVDPRGTAWTTGLTFGPSGCATPAQGPAAAAAAANFPT